MLENIGREEVKKMDDNQLKMELVKLTTELYEKHGYSVNEASCFVKNCYLLINELRTRYPNEPIKLI